MKAIICTMVIAFLFGNFARAEEYEPVTIIKANWGGESGDFGLAREAEGNCPQSLSVDERGNLAILDAVNNRVQLFSSLGNWLKNIPISTRGFDVKYIEEKIYVLAPYDYVLEEFDHIGKSKRKIEINRRIDLIDGLRVEDNLVCLQTYEQNQYRIDANISKDMQLQTEQAGMTGGTSNFRIQTRWLNQHEGALLSEDKRSGKIETFPVKTTEELGSILFLDTDKFGNIFIRLELFGHDGQSVFEIQKLSKTGEVISTFRIINENIVMPYRPITVDSEGNVYSLEIRADGFSVVKWRVKR